MFAAPRRVSLGIVCLVAISAACSKPVGSEAGSPRDTTAAVAPKAADSAVASANLRGPSWKLVSLGDTPVAATADTQRVAHIVLQPDSKNVAGSGGCNRLFGVYELNGDALRFSGVGSTKMACKDGMDTEAAFLQALLRVARWRITGQQLELTDSAGTVVARFAVR